MTVTFSQKIFARNKAALTAATSSRLHQAIEVRLRVAARLYEIGKISLARLKLGIRQSPAKEFVAQPHAIGVEHMAFAVICNLANVPVGIQISQPLRRSFHLPSPEC